MSKRLAVVTGTSAGIGQAVADQLLAAGWDVVGLSRREAPLRHEAYRHVTLDLADLQAVERYFEQRFADEAGLAGYERVGLVNNAGLLEPVGPVSRISMADLERAFAVNTVAPVWLMGYLVRACPRAVLRLVNVSSGAAANPYAGWTAYCATKAALRMAGMTLAQDLEHNREGLGGPDDLAVLSYEPGIVNTDMQGQARSASPEDFPAVQRFVGFYEQGRLLPPERPAGEIVGFLDSGRQPPFSERRIGG